MQCQIRDQRHADIKLSWFLLNSWWGDEALECNWWIYQQETSAANHGRTGKSSVGFEITWGSQPTDIGQHHCLPGCALFRSGNEHFLMSMFKTFSFADPALWACRRPCIPPNLTGEGFLAKQKKPKEVYQYVNEENPSRCFVQLYKLYSSKYPENSTLKCFLPDSTAQPKGECVVFKNLLGSQFTQWSHEWARFEGHFTNHSLRVLSATRLIDAQVDEQLIMSRTGHSSTDGVHFYKRASNKLKQITSDVLSNTKPKTTQEPGPGSSSKEQPPVKCRWTDDSVEMPPAKRVCSENKENCIHTIQISELP